MKTKFIAEDGREFENEDSCLDYENSLKNTVEYRVNEWLKSHTGRHILDSYSLSDYGVWRVLGEDGNADFHGGRQIPYLGTFEGTLNSVIKHAVQLPRFYSWGRGGTIEKIEVIKV